MRRKTVHFAFAAVAFACAAFAACEAVSLERASRIDEAIAHVSSDRPRPVLAPADGAGRMDSASAAGAGRMDTASADGARQMDSAPLNGAERMDTAPRRVVLAQAVALAAAGRDGEAGRRYEALIEGEPLDEIGRAALFDLGNLYLRQGAGNGADAVRSAPMVEQAKARYRALLRVAPDDWDARYNLERALRLMPELAGGADEPNGAMKHNVRARGAQSEDLP